MNNEEAIRIINQMIAHEIVTGNRGKIEALGAALRALERQARKNKWTTEDTNGSY